MIKKEELKSLDPYQEEDESLEKLISKVEKFRLLQTQDSYSQLRNEREKATFSMMMRMNPDALTNIRKEFFAREDEISLEEFIYIIQKHLINQNGDETFIMETPEQREFGTNMFELFKDIDVNGDGNLEWQVKYIHCLIFCYTLHPNLRNSLLSR